jgi:hypothetical protein
MPFIVDCPNYQSQPFPARANAERWKADVEKLDACHGPHEIMEVSEDAAQAAPRRGRSKNE